MNFFEKYRLHDVGPTRTRLAELISIFDTERATMTVTELEELREEIDTLTARLVDERDGGTYTGAS